MGLNRQRSCLKDKWDAAHQIDAGMLWELQNPRNFSASRLDLTMTGQFKDIKCEVVARLARYLIRFAEQGSAETLVQDFERDLFD